MTHLRSHLSRIHLLRRLRKRFASYCGQDADSFLWRCSGVIHVGANVGHEMQDYADRGLAVLWIEPIPEIFRILCDRISRFANQSAVQALVTDETGKDCSFHISSNNGESSSIYEPAQVTDIWPQLGFGRTISLTSITLPELLETNRINIRRFDCLVLDTQGSELLVLKGAERILRQFKFIKTEAADFEAYAGCGRLEEICSYLEGLGFAEVERRQLASHPDGGAYFDVVFQRD